MSHIVYSAPAALQSYYQIFPSGAEAYGQGDGLRPLRSQHLEFTGALAGHHTAATDGSSTVSPASSPLCNALTA